MTGAKASIMIPQWLGIFHHTQDTHPVPTMSHWILGHKGRLTVKASHESAPCVQEPSAAAQASGSTIRATWGIGSFGVTYPGKPSASAQPSNGSREPTGTRGPLHAGAAGRPLASTPPSGGIKASTGPKNSQTPQLTSLTGMVTSVAW